VNKKTNKDPELGISGKAVKVVDQIVMQLMARLTADAAGVAKLGKKSTLSSDHVEAAARLAMPFALAKHAVSEGTRALAAFKQPVDAAA